MDRSQLRKLAQQYARGEIEEIEYRDLRTQLIDGITEGRIPIVREPETTPSVGGAASLPGPVAATDERGPTFTPLPVLVGLAVLALVLWLLFPAGERTPSPPPNQDAAPPSPPTAAAPAPGPGVRLVEEFVALNDWSDDTVSSFRAAWSALTVLERDEAQASSAFARLSNQVHQELEAQQVLANLDGSGRAREVGERVHALGEFLGLTPAPMTRPSLAEPALPTAVADLPTTDLPEIAPVPIAPVEDPAPPAPAHEALPEPQTQAPPAPLPLSKPPQAIVEREPPTANYTLQLFALDSFERAKTLIAQYPSLKLNVVTVRNETPKHRVIHGSFSSEEQAREAYRRLPIDIRREGTGPVVQSTESLRLAALGAAPAPPPPSAGDEQWIGNQPPGSYTLQLFAFNEDGNAQNLIRQYPDLDFRIHRSEDESSPIRVLYGTFETPEAARLAFGALPPALTRAAGKPVVKSLSDLQ